MKKILTLAAFSALLAGCNDTGNEISKAFKFAHTKHELSYAKIGPQTFLVKSDDELYIYDPSANLIAPAPKAVMTKKNLLVEDAVSKGTINFKTIYNFETLEKIQSTAKVEQKKISEIPLEKVGNSVESQEIQKASASSPTIIQKPNEVEISSVSESQPLPQQKSIADVKSTGEKQLAELKASLALKLGVTQAQMSGQKPATMAPSTSTLLNPSVAENNTKSNEAKHEEPSVKLTSGAQYSYFNGTPVLKIAYAEDGMLLSPAAKKERIIETAKKFPMNWTINYPAVGKEKLQLFVFTDYTCPFCHKLHNDIQVLNNAGITVRYMFYPRAYSAGPRTPAAMLTMEQMRRAWCAPDQGEAMTELFETRQIEDYKCESVTEAKNRPQFPGPYHHFFGSLFDLDATPLYFTNDGQMNSGYSDFKDFSANKIVIPK